jgi:hypothetical protein
MCSRCCSYGRIAGGSVTGADPFLANQVCDQPHPLLIRSIMTECEAANLDKALQQLNYLWGLGYSAVDIIGTMFRVVKTASMPEYLKLEFIKVRSALLRLHASWADLSPCAGDRVRPHAGREGNEHSAAAQGPDCTPVRGQGQAGGLWRRPASAGIKKKCSSGGRAVDAMERM